MYRGESIAKKAVRVCKWLDTATCLGQQFCKVRHIFLASRVAGDVSTLSAMKIPAPLIWAVERDQIERQQMIERLLSLGVRVFPGNIADVVRKYRGRDNGSAFLDFCGTLASKEIEGTIREIVSLMCRESVVSITVERRARAYEFDREAALIQMVKESTCFPVSLTQSISYQSRSEDSKGSPMLTMSFFIGSWRAARLDRLQLLNFNEEDLLSLATDRILKAGYQPSMINRFLNNEV